LNSSKLVFVTVSNDGMEESSIFHVLRNISKILEESSASPNPLPVRICIPSLGSPQWGDLETQEIMRFLHLLRSLLRHHPYACAAICLPPDISADGWGGPGWVQKLGWLSDAAITLASFIADLSLSAMFPSHHGLLHIHSLPAPHTILPPSDRFSTLRGISSASSSSGGGENNLAFKCMRKRLLFETLHLDVEGGVGERRTTPATNVMALEEGASHEKATGAVEEASAKAPATATIEVELEEVQKSVVLPSDVTGSEKPEAAAGPKPAKVKKKVAFRSDRPDLYDF